MKLSAIRDAIHAYFTYHMFITPIPMQLSKGLKARIQKAQAHMLEIRSEKVELEMPRHHVVHTFIPEGGSKGKILVNHGWMSQSVHMIGIINALYDAGYSVYAMDFPAHGESKGIQVHWFESVEAIIKANQQLGPFDAAIGHSYGGSMQLCAFCLSEHFNVQPIPKIILIAAPTKINTPIKRASRMLKLTPLAHRRLRRIIRKQHNYDVKLLDAYKCSKNGSSKFLAIHGALDKTIYPQESIDFYKNNPNVTLKIKETMNHINVIYDEEVYADILAFLDNA